MRLPVELLEDGGQPLGDRSFVDATDPQPMLLSAAGAAVTDFNPTS